MVRKFLYGITALVVLIIAGGMALNYWAQDLTEIAFTPRVAFAPQEPLADNAYDDPDLWFARPGLGDSDAGQWIPAGFTTEPAGGEMAQTAVFFIHPTSYLGTDSWNAPLDDTDSRDGARLFVQGMASPFNASPDLWAPRYRQAAIGAFLTYGPERAQALDAAYADIAEAFDYFLSSIGKDTPIILAGHSQGALHLMRLLRDRVSGQPLADRIVAAYVVGWPVSVENDLPALGLPACAVATQSGCVMSWQSYAEPADPQIMLDSFDRLNGLNGQPQKGTQILCTNPLTGQVGGKADATANLGTLVPNADYSNADIVPAAVPARCSDRGILLIGDPPELGSGVLPGNNYHVYDIPLFWANVRADAARRAQAWIERGDNRTAPGTAGMTNAAP